MLAIFEAVESNHEDAADAMAYQMRRDISDSSCYTLKPNLDAIRRHYEIRLKSYEYGLDYPGLGVDAHIEGVTTWQNHTNGYGQGTTHIVVEEDFEHGRLKRKAGQRLCSTKSVWDMSIDYAHWVGGHAELNCKRCREIAASIKAGK